MLKLIMATSQDGFVARGPSDRMKWTGPTDKAIFKLLTLSGSRHCGVGAASVDLMPASLAGRSIVRISRRPAHLFTSMIGTYTLEQFIACGGEWLLGGQTIALEALRLGFVSHVYLTKVPVALGDGIADEVTQATMQSGLSWVDGIHVGPVVVNVWKRP